MAQITAAMVKELRDATGAGMMECKGVLQEADGDIKKAHLLLREKGAAKAVKRAARATTEGKISARISDDERVGSLVEVNIETDFAARNERFVELVEQAADTAIAVRAADRDALLAAKPVGADADDVQALVTDAIGVIGENIGVGAAATLAIDEGQAGLIHAYIHPPGKIGVMIKLTCSSDDVANAEAVKELAHDLCLQIAFSNPVSIDPSSIDQSVVDEEKEVYRNTAIKEGKPEKILDKIVEGRLRAFYKQSCLLEQGFVKEEKKPVKTLIAETAKAAGGEAAIADFVRLQLGASAAGEE